MTIFKSPYDTQACQGFVLNRISQSLEKAFVAGWFGEIGNENNSIRTLSGSSSSMFAETPAFAHPFVLRGEDDDYTIVIDDRPYRKFDGNSGEWVVSNRIGLGNLYLRALLTRCYAESDPTRLRDVHPLPMQVYASWISENITRRFALDPRQQLDLSITAAFFYQSLFTNSTELDEQNKMRIANNIQRGLRISISDVLQVMDKFERNIDGIKDFCEFIKIAVDSVRLEGLNVGVLFDIMGGTWFGDNAKEMVHVALEHPPTWIALVHAAANERSYKNSGLARIVLRNNMAMLGAFGGAVFSLSGYAPLF